MLAAKARLEAGIDGWRKPAGYALGVAADDGTVAWRVTNYPNSHELPAVVLATVLHHSSGTSTYWLEVDQLDEAIELLEPAGACDAFEHPNLWAWQALRTELEEPTIASRSRVVVVFLGSEDDEPVDGPQRQLRAALGLDDRLQV